MDPAFFAGRHKNLGDLCVPRGGLSGRFVILSPVSIASFRWIFKEKRHRELEALFGAI